MRILLADDERRAIICAQSMIEEIQPNQHSFVYARNGLETVEQLMADPPPELALVDYQMPLKTGLEAIEAAGAGAAATRLVLMTGYDMSEHRATLEAQGIWLLNKPFTTRELITVLEG